MELFIELLKEVNIVQIFILIGAGWMFYNRLDKKIGQTNKDLKDAHKELKDDLSCRIDRLAEKVEDVDRRLCRIEGSLATTGHCLFNQAKPEQKAQ